MLAFFEGISARSFFLSATSICIILKVLPGKLISSCEVYRWLLGCSLSSLNALDTELNNPALSMAALGSYK